MAVFSVHDALERRSSNLTCIAGIHKLIKAPRLDRIAFLLSGALPVCSARSHVVIRSDTYNRRIYADIDGPRKGPTRLAG